MINNNPYNIPERPQKQKRIIVESTPPPLYPHQVNRTMDQHEQKSRHFLHKRATLPYFLQGSVTDLSKISHNPQTPNHSASLQMSSVSQWNGLQSNCQPTAVDELNEKIANINARLDSHQRKLAMVMEVRKQEQPVTHLSESTSLSQEMFSQPSRQMERYHSAEEPWDKLREEFSSYLSQSQKMSQNLRAQFSCQKDSITHQLISNFKDCLREKFSQEEQKITEYLSQYEQQEMVRFNERVIEVKEGLKGELDKIIRQIAGKSEGESFSSELKAKLGELTCFFKDLQSDYAGFKDEVFDHVLATQDQKRWMYQIQDKLSRCSKVQKQFMLPGNIQVSQEYCQNKVMHLCYEEYLNIAEKTSQMPVSAGKRIYLIDGEGYLLDSNHHYLVTGRGQKIRLLEVEVKRLREAGMLQ